MLEYKGEVNMNYIEEMKQDSRLDLAKEMQMSRLEKPINLFYEVKRGKLFFYHTKDNNINKYTTSIYDQFEIIQLYDLKPSEYDQQRYRNFMTMIFGEKYKKDLNSYMKKLKQENKLEDANDDGASL